jgi:protein TonB
MKLTPLKLSFCISLLVHGTILSAFYAVRYANADARPPSVIANFGAIEIVVEPEPLAVSVSEPQPVAVKISETVPDANPIQSVIIPDAKSQTDAIATFPTIQQNNSTIAEVGRHVTETKNVTTEIVTPTTSSSIVNYLTNPKPVYPREARKHKEQGLIVMGVAVSEKGCPVNVWVIQSSGYLLLDESAQTAIEKWQFVPARVGNMAIRSQVEVPIRFRLSD